MQKPEWKKVSHGSVALNSVGTTNVERQSHTKGLRMRDLYNVNHPAVRKPARPALQKLLLHECFNQGARPP